VARRSATQFLSQHSHWCSNESQTSVDNMLHQFTEPINTSMRSVRSIFAHGVNPSVLNRHRRGYNLGDIDLSYTTPRPSQPTVFTFNLRVPPGLQFNPNLSKIPKFKFKGSMATTWSFDHSVIYHILHLRLVIANDLCLGIGSTRIDRKVILIQLGYQSNSYDLMHNQES
jgi:hypothetical protein